MSFPLADAVMVIGCCYLLWWIPKPYQLTPIVAALVFPLYPVDAALTALITGIMLGALLRAFKLGME